MSAVAMVLPRRCAVYCRVSSDERLDQSFNSIDAHREAGLAFIASQAQEGWTALPDTYEDPGFSGGNMERPGLRRLLGDIEAGRVDIVVVYKIDRLSRSLADFAKMVEIFDRSGASFSSVTQQINSATSMGRLMLNVLLSFAQFEREVTAERIRDKIAASKKRGIWMGGHVAYGYAVKERKLEIVPAEAKVVVSVFERFVQLRSITEVCRRLAEDGVAKSDKRYGYGTSAFGTIPVAQLDAIVIHQVVGALQSPETTQVVWDRVQAMDRRIQEPTVVLAMRSLGEVWQQLFAEEQQRIVRLLIERVNVEEDGIDIHWRESGWMGLAGELAPGSIGSEMREMEDA